MTGTEFNRSHRYEKQIWDENDDKAVGETEHFSAPNNKIYVCGYTGVYSVKDRKKSLVLIQNCHFFPSKFNLNSAVTKFCEVVNISAVNQQHLNLHNKEQAVKTCVGLMIESTDLLWSVKWDKEAAELYTQILFKQPIIRVHHTRVLQPVHVYTCGCTHCTMWTYIMTYSIFNILKATSMVPTPS